MHSTTNASISSCLLTTHTRDILYIKTNRERGAADRAYAKPTTIIALLHLSAAHRTFVRHKAYVGIHTKYYRAFDVRCLGCPPRYFGAYYIYESRGAEGKTVKNTIYACKHTRGTKPNTTEVYHAEGERCTHKISPNSK